MWNFLKKALYIGAGLIGLLIVVIVLEDMRAKPSGKVKSLIEQGDYIKAKQIAKNASDRLQASSAQVNDLIGQGQFDLASQVAKEDQLYIAYFDGVFDHLSQIYNDQGKERLLYALSIIQFPDTKNLFVDEAVWGQRGDFHSIKSRDVVKGSNARIETFCDYLNLSGNKSFIPQVLNFLRPVYSLEERHYDRNKEEWIVDKKAGMDNSEVIRIKKKFGY